MNKYYTPTAPEKRVVIVDIVRGFAIFGILFSNILVFSGYLFTPFTQLEQMPMAGLKGSLYTLSTILVSGKFYPIFCMLFGYGFFMQAAKYSGKREGFTAYYSKRLFILLIIGLLHQLIWPGDVISNYALVGFLLLIVHRVGARGLRGLSVLFIVLYLIVGLWPKMFPPGQTESAEEWTPSAAIQFPDIEPQRLIEGVRHDGIGGVYRLYGPQYRYLWSFSRMKTIVLSITALFLLGGYLFRSGFFTGPGFKPRTLFLFFILGGAGHLLMLNVATPFRIIENLFGGLLYIGLFHRLYRSGWGEKLLRLLAPVGKMAMTVYIMQTIVCGAVFYGIGLGLFAQLPLYEVYFIALLIFSVQLLFCRLWLSRFNYGPLEWVWRSLSYRKRIPMKLLSK